MVEWKELCTEDQVIEGTMKDFRVAGQDVVLAKVNGVYRAFSGRCPHMAGKLSEGKLDGTVITCPLHGSRFDVTDGHVIQWTNLPGFAAKLGTIIKPAVSLKVYRLKVEANKVMVEI